MPRDDTPSAGHNDAIDGLTRPQFLAFYREELGIETKIAELTTRKQKLRKQMKADGVVLGDYDAFKRLFAKEAEEQQAYFTNLKTYLAWAGVPIGTQMDFGFGAPAEDEDDEARAVRIAERAQSDGFAAGLRGDEIDSGPYDATTPAGQAWLRGYHEAQEMAVLERIKVRETLDAPDEDDDEDEDHEDDDEDVAPKPAARRRGRPRKLA